ncbi:Hypothetical protein FKW44_009862, partial [Caligus rogercresseyi]
CILLGDLNLVLKHRRDTWGYIKENNRRSTAKFNDIVNKRGLMDIAARLSKNPDHTFFIKRNGIVVK